MLIVTGTQRAGTSLIATVLSESGYGLGGIPWDEVGGYENEIICGFYRDYLGDPRFPFDDFPWPPAVVGDFANMDYPVVKFSYLLMNPVFVTIWHKFRPKGDTFLVMDRDKEHVIASKERWPDRFKHDSMLLQQRPEQLRWNFWDSWLLLHQFDYKMEVLQFPACVQDPEGVNAALARLDPTVQFDMDVWNRVADPSKIHFR